MDDYTIQQELETLAGNAFQPDAAGEPSDNQPEPMGMTIARWQKLFDYSADEAVDRIMLHRNDLTRTRISLEHWNILRKEKEAEGYNREAYEYELDLQKKRSVVSDMVPVAMGAQESKIRYLVEIGGPLDTKEKVRVAAELDHVPAVVSGWSTEDGREVELCVVDVAGKDAVLKWAVGDGKGYEPTILVDPRSLR